MISNLNLYFSPTKMIKMALMSIPIALIGMYCMKSDDVILKTIGAFEIVLSLSLLFVALKSVFNKKPQVIIDENGIIDNRILKNTIPWNQMQKLELTIIYNQKCLQLSIGDNFDNANFKWLFRKTSKEKLNQNPKSVLVNLDQLKIDYDSLNEFLSNKVVDFIPKNLDENLTGVGYYLNKILY